MLNALEATELVISSDHSHVGQKDRAFSLKLVPKR